MMALSLKAANSAVLTRAPSSGVCGVLSGRGARLTQSRSSSSISEARSPPELRSSPASSTTVRRVAVAAAGDPDPRPAGPDEQRAHQADDAEQHAAQRDALAGESLTWSLTQRSTRSKWIEPLPSGSCTVSPGDSLIRALGPSRLGSALGKVFMFACRSSRPTAACRCRGRGRRGRGQRQHRVELVGELRERPGRPRVAVGRQEEPLEAELLGLRVGHLDHAEGRERRVLRQEHHRPG